VLYANIYTDSIVYVSDVVGCADILVGRTYTISAVGFRDTTVQASKNHRLVMRDVAYDLAQAVIVAGPARFIPPCEERPNHIFGRFVRSEASGQDAPTNYLEYGQLLRILDTSSQIVLESISIYSFYNTVKYNGFLKIYEVSREGSINDISIISPVPIDKKLKRGKWTKIDLPTKIRLDGSQTKIYLVGMYSMKPLYPSTTQNKNGLRLLDNNALVFGPAYCRKSSANIYYRQHPGDRWSHKPASGEIFNIAYYIH